MIEPLSRDQQARRGSVALLHSREIPYGDLAAFGPELLGRFYYGVLLDDPDFACAVYLFEGEVAGFAAFSRDFGAVRRRAVRKHGLLLIWLLATAVVRAPRRLRALFELLLPIRSASSAVPRAEALSLAVAERYRSSEFFQKTGLRIGVALYVHIGKTLYEMGEREAKAFSRSDNVLANATLRSLGWRVVGSPANGRDLEWRWDLERAARRFSFSGAAR